MKKNPPAPEPYTTQRLRTWADMRIRTRLIFVFMRKSFASSGAHASLVSGALIVAMLILVIAPQGLTSLRIRGFVAKAEAAQLEIRTRSENEILHRTFVVAEGRDKGAFVAKQTNLPLDEVSSVPLRHDTIEEWRTGVTNLSYIESDVLGRPIRVKLNLENKDHMHIFEYAPRTCATQVRDGIQTPECENARKATPQYVTHRNQFDSVHDIATLYEDEIQYNAAPSPAFDFAELTYRGREIINDKPYEVFTSSSEGIETEYHFDTETYLLKKRIITIVDGNERYEMSVMEEIDHDFLAADHTPDIFNPERYAFKQIEVIPLTQ